MIDPVIWGQILLAAVTGIISLLGSIGTLIMLRSRTNLKIALKEAEARAKDAEAKAQERVIAAEKDLREAVDTNVLIARLIEHLSETSKRASEDDARNREALVQVLDASRKSTDILQSLVTTVKTDLGENTHALRLLEQVVAGLPTRLDERTNPLADAVTKMLQRIDKAMDGLDEAKRQIVEEITSAIREALQAQAKNQTTPIPTSTEGL